MTKPENSETSSVMSRCFLSQVGQRYAVRLMITNTRRHIRTSLAGIWFLLLVLLVPVLANQPLPVIDKMTPEELVNKHLESIGSAAARASVTTRIIAGKSLVTFRTPPPGQAAGRAVLASEGSRILIGMSFPSPVYPLEQLGFNGNSFMAAYVTPGVRSALGNFLMTHPLIFRQGLMGGALSTAWPLLDLSAHNAQLEYAGLKKVDKKKLHELRYLVRGGSDLRVTLFFEEETFRHVRTEYERVIPASIGTRSEIDAKEKETRYKMIEEFSEFKTEGGLNLPHNYKIKLTVDSSSGTFLADWEINLNQFTFNERIDPNSFTIGAS